jgi:hypothetical protein
VGRTALELVPDLDPRWVEIYGEVALTGEVVAAGFDRHFAKPGDIAALESFLDSTLGDCAEDARSTR